MTKHSDGTDYLPTLHPGVTVLDPQGTADDGEVVAQCYARMQAQDWQEGMRLYLRYHRKN